MLKSTIFIENDEFQLDVTSSMPNVVIYTFNDTKDWDSDFNIYKPHSGISLETQFYLMILICMVIKQTLF